MNHISCLSATRQWDNRGCEPQGECLEAWQAKLQRGWELSILNFAIRPCKRFWERAKWYLILRKKKLEEIKTKGQVVEELSFLKHLPNKHGIQIPSNLVLGYLLSSVDQSLLPLFFFFLLTRHIYSIFEKIKFLTSWIHPDFRSQAVVSAWNSSPISTSGAQTTVMVTSYVDLLYTP